MLQKVIKVFIVVNGHSATRTRLKLLDVKEPCNWCHSMSGLMDGCNKMSKAFTHSSFSSHISAHLPHCYTISPH